ncbi:hypothetical protein GCM10007981_06740 [Thermocladium modestius]|uniref:Rubrerythrin diiron-binding domain-containing protein n=1 Tax=Thermocladium modestius TaxID=62609 RepID=A0A830GUD1_9CREN|nr:ferritin family protein [Thermocladium modestius]GGP20086.1 hypothetical protein GCM10007981_06740 [Thermocladium modestius]
MDLEELRRKAERALQAEARALSSLLEISRNAGEETAELLSTVIFETALHMEIMRGIMTAVDLTRRAGESGFRGSAGLSDVRRELGKQDEIEREAYELYLDLAKTEENSFVRELFNAIARDEEVHHALLKYVESRALSGPPHG